MFLFHSVLVISVLLSLLYLIIESVLWDSHPWIDCWLLTVICLSIYQSIIHLSVIRPSTYSLIIRPFVHPSIYHSSIHKSIYPSSNNLHIHHPFINPITQPSIHAFICSSIHTSPHPAIYISIRPCIIHWSIHLSIHLSDSVIDQCLLCFNRNYYKDQPYAISWVCSSELEHDHQELWRQRKVFILLLL